MKNEDKAKSLFFHFCNEKSCKGYDECVNCPNAKVHEGLIQMAEWKDKENEKQIKRLKKEISKLKERAKDVNLWNKRRMEEHEEDLYVCVGKILEELCNDDEEYRFYIIQFKSLLLSNL